MAVKFFSAEQIPRSQSLELVTIVIVINVVIGLFTEEDIK